MVIDRLGAEGQPPLAPEQRSGAVGPGAGFAERGPTGGAGAATAATRHEDEHDMIADGEIADALAQRLDDPGGLVAKRHRGRARTRSVDD